MGTGSNPPYFGRRSLRAWVSEGQTGNQWNHAMQLLNRGYSSIGCGMAVESGVSLYRFCSIYACHFGGGPGASAAGAVVYNYDGWYDSRAPHAVPSAN